MKRFAAVIALAAAGSVIIASNPADAAKKVKADVSPNELKTSFSRGHYYRHSDPHPLEIARLFIDIIDIVDRDDWDYGPPPPPPPPPPRWHRPPPHHRPHWRPGPGPRPQWRPGPGPRGPRPGPHFRPAPPRGPRPGPGPRPPHRGPGGPRGPRPPRH